MKVSFRVVSTITGNDLTDKEHWLLDPSGKLLYKRDDSLYVDSGAKAVFKIDEEDCL